MRYSSFLISAVIISLLTFLGMSYLVTNPSAFQSTPTQTISFGSIREVKADTANKRALKKQPPKKAVTKNPPAAPKLDLNSSSSIEIPLPQGNTKLNVESLSMFTPPNFSFKNGNGNGIKSQELTPVFPIQPLYPAIAARNKIEGWVKVEFIVNEFGKVIQVKIIDSYPSNVFNQATKRAVYKSKFKPLIVNGKAMAQTATQVIEFKFDH